jgi:general secretion pathway protein E/type IV pilus assembly protein PilB
MLIGEMRDEQTAKTAITAATTGHLVLSTLHANTALGAIPRLRGLGLDSLTLAESLVSVVSQRLVRTVCPACREEYAAGPEEQEYLGQEVQTLVRGRGCETCNTTGYLGRTLVYEVFVLDKEIRDMLERDASVTELHQAALSKGYRSMFEVGVIKCLAGQTTVKEMQRVLGRTRF